MITLQNITTAQVKPLKKYAIDQEWFEMTTACETSINIILRFDAFNEYDSTAHRDESMLRQTDIETINFVIDALNKQK